MLRIDVDDGRVAVVARGSSPEMMADLVIGLRAVREEMMQDEWFDFFLKDVFIDLIFAKDNSEITDALISSLRRANGDASEHKQD